VTAGPRVAHLIAEYSAHEAMGRTVAETARRVPGDHHLVTARAHDGTAPFAGVHELGGRLATFPFGCADRLAVVLGRIRPDLVHLHVGALGTLAATLPVLRPLLTVLTVYAWQTLPGLRAFRRASLSEMRSSNVLQPRVALSTVLPPAVAALMLRRAGVRTVLTPDPRVIDRLASRAGLTVTRLPSGPRATATGQASMPTNQPSSSPAGPKAYGAWTRCCPPSRWCADRSRERGCGCC